MSQKTKKKSLLFTPLLSRHGDWTSFLLSSCHDSTSRQPHLDDREFPTFMGKHFLFSQGDLINYFYGGVQ